MNTQKIILIVVGIGLIVAGVWYFASSSEPLSEEEEKSTVAIVNGEEISREDFEELKSQMAAQQGLDLSSLDAEAKSQFEAQVIDELVIQELVEQKADESGATVSQEEIAKQIEETIAQLGGEEAYQEALEEEGLSEEELKELIRTNLVIQAYFEEELDLSSATATEEEVKEFYEKEADQNEEIPPLEEIESQIEGMISQQKQQELMTQLIEELREEADIEILI